MCLASFHIKRDTEKSISANLGIFLPRQCPCSRTTVLKNTRRRPSFFRAKKSMSFRGREATVAIRPIAPKFSRIAAFDSPSGGYRKECHCEPVRKLAWQSVLPPRRHRTQQRLPRNVTSFPVIASQFANWRGNPYPNGKSPPLRPNAPKSRHFPARDRQARPLRRDGKGVPLVGGCA